MIKIYSQFCTFDINCFELKVNLFKLNKNKRFNYNPRYLKDKSIENIYDFDSVYEKQRNYRSSYDLSSVWKEDRSAEERITEDCLPNLSASIKPT